MAVTLSPALSRRRFLQLSAAGAGAVAASPLLGDLEAFAAPPLRTTDPIVVLVMLAGGNDALNMVVPFGDSHYYGLRPSIAIPANQTHALNASSGLHPALTKLKSHFDMGHVAVIRGVGYNPPDLSHFSSMGYWMQGWGGAAQSYATGWIGRYLDDLPNAATESLYSVALGTNGVPLHLVGKQSRGASLPLSVNGRFGIDRSSADDVRLFDAVNSLSFDGRTGLGKWGDMVARTNSQVLRLASRIAPAYPAQRDNDYFVAQMELVGRLVNRNLGIRVFNVVLDGFDTHTDQLPAHQGLMASLDAGIDKLLTTLATSWLDNVMIVTFSEFGRRPAENDNGTDHGTAGVTFAVGTRVKGGLYGTQPSLAPNALDRYDCPVTSVDFRSVYATVVQKWLRGDDKEVLGKTYPQLGFVASTP